MTKNNFNASRGIYKVKGFGTIHKALFLEMFIYLVYSTTVQNLYV